MMIDYNDPVCSCGSLCAQSTSQPAQPKQGSAAGGINAVVQDTTLPTSFFRLFSEIRDKIYFLSCRPDCQYSFGEKEGCDKRHIHNSAKGRISAWKWLVLCRQTWSEANQYMPIIRNDIRFYINDDNCGRCWYQRNRRLREGMLHASLKASRSERGELREIWYMRLQKLSIQFDNIKNSHDETDYRFDRFAHNLDSVIAFVGKLRSLKEIGVEVNPDFAALLGINTDVSGSMTRLFSVLKARINHGSLKIHISQKAYEINASTSEPILQLAALAGLSNNDINLRTIKIDRPQSSFDFDFESFLKPDSWYDDEKRWEASLASQLLYRTRLFDEDFEGILEPDDLDIEIPSGVAGEPINKSTCFIPPFWMYEVQPTYHLRQGCVGRRHNKYSELRELLPLYIEEDFYYRSESATQEYQPIPECFGCGIMFSGFEQMTAHVDQCTGRDDSMTRVQSPCED